MIHYLLRYQFSFLYSICVVIGLLVYGSDFSRLPSWLVVSPFFLGLFIHWFFRRRILVLLAGIWLRLVFAGGAVIAVLAYRTVHFSFWDEHALDQSLLVALAGMVSYIAALTAAGRENPKGKNRKVQQAGVFLLFAMTWLLSSWYPMFPLLMIAVILLLAAMTESASTVNPSHLHKVNGFIGYGIFLLMLDIGLVIWDFQVNTTWGGYLAGAFVFVAIGFVMYRPGNNYSRMIYGIIVGNYLLAVIWPVFVIAWPHIIISGLCLGWFIALTVAPDANSGYELGFIKFAVPVIAGLTLGFLFYSNFEFAYLRSLLVIPAFWFLVKGGGMPLVKIQS